MFVPGDGEKVCECVLIVLYALICMYYLYICSLIEKLLKNYAFICYIAGL